MESSSSSAESSTGAGAGAGACRPGGGTRPGGARNVGLCEPLGEQMAGSCIGGGGGCSLTIAKAGAWDGGGGSTWPSKPSLGACIWARGWAGCDGVRGNGCSKVAGRVGATRSCLLLSSAWLRGSWAMMPWWTPRMSFEDNALALIAATFNAFRSLISPLGHRWHLWQAWPLAHPSVFQSQAQGMHLPAACKAEPMEGSASGMTGKGSPGGLCAGCPGGLCAGGGGT
mmetsp:Transcript_19493/g.49879  ORF Transcript_19493/g.49879 Transcript_19493/m.49879 type:complete len:227 (-) Transcript_19493:300-980(-)